MPNFVRGKRLQKRVIKYFLEKNSMDEKHAISKDAIQNDLNIGDEDMSNIVDDFFRESIINKLIIQCERGYYVDPMTYSWRHKYQYIHYLGYVVLAIVFILFAHYSFIKSR